MIKGAGTADSNRIGWPIQIESRSFAGPYHEGAYLLFPNLFQFVLKAVDTFTINICLIQLVPAVDNAFGEEILPQVQIDSLFNNLPCMSTSPLLILDFKKNVSNGIADHFSSCKLPEDLLCFFALLMTKCPEFLTVPRIQWCYVTGCSVTPKVGLRFLLLAPSYTHCCRAKPLRQLGFVVL